MMLPEILKAAVWDWQSPRSFTELQGGSIKVLVDGDLFKVILKFAVLEKAAEREEGNEEQA